MAYATAPGRLDPESVTLIEVTEVRYWCGRFDVRPKELKRAVRAVGNNPADVERYIRGHIRQAVKESNAEGD